MKKRERKTEKEKPKNLNSSLGPVNIEPPKIYREDQRNKQNLNRAELRHKQNKKRKLKNSVRNALIMIAFLIVLISVGVVLSLTTFFKIETINVTGSGIYSTEEIIDNCGINKGENLFLIDKENCKAKLEKNLPYVYDVKIKKQLSSTINIEITDAKAEYSIQKEDKTFILLDDNFKVLDNAATENVDGTINIINSEITNAENGSKIVFKDENISDCLSKMSAVIKDINMTEATAISSSSINTNYIVYEGRITFSLGNCDNLESKVYKGLASCDKLNKSKPNAKGTLDLSSDKQIYFTEG